jgi:copper homeostasis protein
MSVTIKIEICINSDAHAAQSVRAAYLGGADTIELCSQMELAGLTPLPKDIAIAREAFAGRPGLMVMIRPRGGDFCYSRTEIGQMEQEIETAVSLGADGVVFGVVQNNRLHIPHMRRLIRAAHNHSQIVTCHRAFDVTSDPEEALETLIDWGVDRVLTSGTPWGSSQTAAENIPQLARLIRRADNRIEIVLGGGIHSENIRRLLTGLPTDGARLAVHAYSGVLRDGVANQDAVRQLVTAVNSGIGEK